VNPAAASPEQRQGDLAAFVDRIVAEIEPLHLRHNEAVWKANVTGDPAHEQESARLDAEIRTIFSRREPFQFLSGLLAAGGVPDPKLQRQAVLLHHTFRAHQIPPETIERMVKIEKGLESRFNNFRAELDGARVTDNQLLEVLRLENDSARRRRAWEASKQIGREVRADLLELVGIRNRAARDLGFPNYYSMMLELDELDERELFAVLDDLERGTRPLFEAYKRELDARLGRRFGVAAAEIRPWHYSDPFFQEAPAAEVDLDACFPGQSLEQLTRRFYHAIGFQIDDLLARADLYERPGKCQHAFCLSVDHRQDIRVLCNLRPTERWMSTMLHEFGHAVYDQSIDPGLPFLLRSPAHTLATEASAMLFGRLSKNAAWLTTYAGMEAGEARRAGEAVARAICGQLLVQTRWCLVMCHMERALYRDPAQDLDRVWWDLVERFQSLTRPEGRSGPDWASKIHFSVAPVYYHNYLLGEMMASQLQRHIQREVLRNGGDVWQRYVTSPEVGGFLRSRLYRTGRLMDWRETLRQATGEALSPAALVDELAARSPREGRIE
jgi:peptidyl-dipeptidase A